MLRKYSLRKDSNIVCKVPSMDCDLFYLGQTSKELNTRLKQHKYSVRTGQTNNVLFLYLSEKSHRINWTQSNVILGSNETISRNSLVSTMIQLTWGKNLNLRQGLFPFDPVIKHMFLKDLKDRIQRITNR